MVEDVVRVCLVVLVADHARVLRVSTLVHVAAHGEAGAAVVHLVLHLVAPRHRHVVHDPVVLVVHEHPLLQLRQLLYRVSVVRLVLLSSTQYLEKKIRVGQIQVRQIQLRLCTEDINQNQKQFGWNRIKTN